MGVSLAGVAGAGGAWARIKTGSSSVSGRKMPS